MEENMKLFFKLTVLSMALLGLSVSALANVNAKKSEFKWNAFKKVGDGHYGKIFLKSAKADIKDGKVAGGEFVMDMKSFTVDDLSGTWETKFLKHVKSGDFFQVDKFPVAKLVITSVKGNTAKGKLTIKDKTNTETINFKKGKDGSFTGTLTFDRTKYDVKYGSENFFELAADKVIKNEVKLEFKIAMK